MYLDFKLKFDGHTRTCRVQVIEEKIYCSNCKHCDSPYSCCRASEYRPNRNYNHRIRKFYARTECTAKAIELIEKQKTTKEQRRLF